MGDFLLALFLSVIRFFQLSATAGPHRAGADGNHALFSFPKIENTFLLDDVTCWKNFALFPVWTSFKEL
jgi:hypothetical protein